MLTGQTRSFFNSNFNEININNGHLSILFGEKYRNLYYRNGPIIVTAGYPHGFWDGEGKKSKTRKLARLRVLARSPGLPKFRVPNAYIHQ